MFDDKITTRKFLNNTSSFFIDKTGDGVCYSARKIAPDEWEVFRHDLREHHGVERWVTFGDDVKIGVIQGRAAVIQALSNYEEELKKAKYDRAEPLPCHYTDIAKRAGIYIDAEGRCFDVQPDAIVKHAVNFKTRALGDLYHLVALRQPKPVKGQVASWDQYYETIINHDPLRENRLAGGVRDWCEKTQENIHKMHAAVVDPSMIFSERCMAVNAVYCRGIRIDDDPDLNRAYNIWRLTALLQAGQTVCRQMFEGAAMSPDEHGLLVHIRDAARQVMSSYPDLAEPSVEASILNLMAMPDDKPRKDQPLERLLKRLDKKAANPKNGYSP